MSSRQVTTDTAECKPIFLQGNSLWPRDIASQLPESSHQDHFTVSRSAGLCLVQTHLKISFCNVSAHIPH